MASKVFFLATWPGLRAPWLRPGPGAGGNLHDDTPVHRPSRAHLQRMLHCVLRAVHKVVTPGWFDRSNLTQEPPKVAMSCEDLCQAVREDAATIVACPMASKMTILREVNLEEESILCRSQIICWGRSTMIVFFFKKKRCLTIWKNIEKSQTHTAKPGTTTCRHNYLNPQHAAQQSITQPLRQSCRKMLLQSVK